MASWSRSNSRGESGKRLTRLSSRQLSGPAARKCLNIYSGKTEKLSVSGPSLDPSVVKTVHIWTLATTAQFHWVVLDEFRYKTNLCGPFTLHKHQTLKSWWKDWKRIRLRGWIGTCLTSPVLVLFPPKPCPRMALNFVCHLTEDNVQEESWRRVGPDGFHSFPHGLSS